MLAGSSSTPTAGNLKPLLLAAGRPGCGAPADLLANQGFPPRPGADPMIPALMKHPRAREPVRVCVYRDRPLCHRLQGRSQTSHLELGELVGRPQRRDPRLVKDLVGDPVPDPREQTLVQ